MIARKVRVDVPITASLPLLEFGSPILAFRAPCVPGMMSPRSGSFNKSSSMAKSTFVDARSSICLMNTGVSKKL